MCDLGDLEPCPVWNEWVRIMSTATFKGQPHECDGCGAIIARGDAYLGHSSFWDGRWAGERMCFACWWTREVFGDAHSGNCVPSALWEQLQECIGENDDDEDEWRDHLAAMKKRHRSSPSWSRTLWRRWTDHRERLREIVLACDGFGGAA